MFVCRICHVARTTAWKAANRELARASVNRWRERNKPLKNELALAFAKRYPERMNARNAKRRALKRNAIPVWANHFFIKEAYDLAQRRTKATGFKWQVDHIVPLKSPLVCGLHTHTNLQVISMAANVAKKNFVWPDMP